MPDARILIYNYSMNSDNSIFSHQLQIANFVHARLPRTAIITAECQRTDFDLQRFPFAISLGWKPSQPLKNLFRLLVAFFKSEQSFKPDIVFFHMTNLQSCLLGPVYRILGRKQILWYAHRSNPLTLRISSLFMDKLLTSTPGSIPHGYPAVPIGQAIDTNLFHFYDQFYQLSEIKLIHIGRLDPSKRIDELIEFAEKNRENFNISHITFVGTFSPQNHDYLESIMIQHKKSIDSRFVRFVGAQNRLVLPSILKQHNLFLHFFEGSLDKALLEAVCFGIPVVSINSEFLSLFGSRSGAGAEDVDYLKKEITALRSLAPRELRELLVARSEIVKEHHSIETWLNNFFRVISGLKA